VTYRKSTPTAYTDPENFRICKVLDHFELVIRPGAYLVDRVPLLRYLTKSMQTLVRARQKQNSEGFFF